MQVGGYVYTIRKPIEAINVNATLGSHRLAYELEFAIPSKLNPKDIMGARQVGADGRSIGSFIKNPNYIP